MDGRTDRWTDRYFFNISETAMPWLFDENYRNIFFFYVKV
jgi:hypothetical protein